MFVQTQWAGIRGQTLDSLSSERLGQSSSRSNGSEFDAFNFERVLITWWGAVAAFGNSLTLVLSDTRHHLVQPHSVPKRPGWYLEHSRLRGEDGRLIVAGQCDVAILKVDLQLERSVYVASKSRCPSQ